MDEINSRVVVYFARGDDPAQLNRAALYVMQNEQTNRLKVVHVHASDAEIPEQLAEHLKMIDRLYPRLNVPKNYMFIGTPGDRFPHRIADLGGVRLIL